MSAIPRTRFIWMAACLWWAAAIAAAAEPDSDKAKDGLERLCKVFPELHWYASDACLRETSRAGGHPNQRDEFIKSHRAVVEKVAQLGKEGRKFFMGRLKLHDPSDQKEYWLFDLRNRGQGWEPVAGVKVMGGRRLNLFEADLFMGSMKPYFEKGLQAYAEGKDLSKVFPGKDGKP